jgi:hypothetical protein
MSPPEAICFDLDSTLCLSTQSDHKIHAQVFEQAGIEPLFSPCQQPHPTRLCFRLGIGSPALLEGGASAS